MKDMPWMMQPQSQTGNVEDTIDWGEHEYGTHRYHVHRLMDDSIRLLPKPEKVIVLGAGNHGDVNLPGLSLHFQQVTVLDTEDNMLEEWLEETGGLASNRIKSLTRVDYTRLDQLSFYEQLEELLMNEAKASDIAGFLRNASFEVQRYEAVPHLKKSFSLVVSSGVHTQLFYPDALLQFHGYIDRYNEADIRLIMEALAYLRNSLVADYNKLLLSLLQPDGRITVWTDMILLDEEKAWIADKLYEPMSEQERLRFLFDSFGKYGMETAVLGLKELHDHIQADQLLFRSWIGRTDSGKSYITVGLSGCLRN